MFNKNDPLIGAVQQVMQKSNADRDAIKSVNEKFGVADRKALPHEKQGEWDAAYQQMISEGSESLGKLAPPYNKVTHKDVLVGRGVLKKKGDKHVVAEEELEEGQDPYAENEGAGAVTQVKSKEKEITPADQSALKNKIQSIKEAKGNAYAIGMASVKKSTGDEPPMEKKNIMKAHKIAKKILAKKKMNEGFNNRHDSSVTASVEEQVVAEAAKARSDYGLGATPAPKNAAAARAKIDTAMEPVVKVAKAVTPGADAFDKISQGDYKGAAASAALDVAGGALVGGALKAGKAAYNLAKTSGKVAAGTEKVAATTAKATTPAVVKQTTSVADRFKTNYANKRFNVSGAQAKPTPPAKTTQSGVPSVARTPGNKIGIGGKQAAAEKTGPWNRVGPNAPARPTTPNAPNAGAAAASRMSATQRLSKTAQDIRAGAGRAASGAVNAVKANPKLAAGAAAGAALGGFAATQLANKPAGTSAATPPTPAPKPTPKPAAPVAAKPVAAKTAPAPAKPAAQQPVQKKVVPQAPAKPILQSRNQRDNTIGASGKSTQGPGGVTSGTKTGTTITNKPAVAKKAPVGTGRVK